MGKADKIAADSGYASESNKQYAKDCGVDLHLPKGREKHNQFLAKKEENKTKEQEERDKLYAKRKSTIEPVFGVIKSVIGFNKFSLRGIVAAAGEWSLVCVCYNLKRLHTISLSNG